jgi:hypothetical protein
MSGGGAMKTLTIYRTMLGVYCTEPSPDIVRRISLNEESMATLQVAVEVLRELLEIDVVVGMPERGTGWSVEQRANKQSPIEIGYVEAGTGALQIVGEAQFALLKHAATPEKVILVSTVWDKDAVNAKEFLEKKLKCQVVPVCKYAVSDVKNCTVVKELTIVTPRTTTALQTQWVPTAAALSSHEAHCALCRDEAYFNRVKEMYLRDETSTAMLDVLHAELMLKITQNELEEHLKMLPFLVDDSDVERLQYKLKRIRNGEITQQLSEGEQRILATKQDIENTKQKLQQLILGEALPVLVENIVSGAASGAAPVRDLSQALKDLFSVAQQLSPPAQREAHRNKPIASEKVTSLAGILGKKEVLRPKVVNK